MSLFSSFLGLPLATSAADFSAMPLPGTRGDFLAKGRDGGPVFLLRDSSPASYSPAIELMYVGVQFHCTCRVTTATGMTEGQFAVIFCDVGAHELHEVFIRCLAAAAEQLPGNASTPDLQRCIQSLLDLFRDLGRPSSREVTGLWAELFVIARSKSVPQALRAWHADQFERFDFSWSSGCLEVKASTRELRQHDFALEQLQRPLGGVGYIVSILLQNQGGGVGVVDLANEIEVGVAGEPQLRRKLWEGILAALGSDFSERLDRQFDPSYAERSLAIYAMEDIPAPCQPADPRVSGIRFHADLSTVCSSFGGSGKAVFDSLFS